MAIITSILSYLLSLWPIFGVILVIALSTILFFKKGNKKQDAWSEGIPEIKPNAIWGNDIPSADGFLIQYDKVYTAMKGLKYCLYYNGGTWARGIKKVLILDPELVVKVTQTDFDHFVDNQFFSQEYTDAVGQLFGIADAQGDRWRRLRKAVNGPFALPKMKSYMEFFSKANKSILGFLEEESGKGEKMDVRDLVRRYVINTVGAVALGMDVNAFVDRDCELMKQGSSLSEMWRWIVVMMMPSIAALFKVQVYNQKAEKWFTSLMRRYIKTKPLDGNDVLSLLMKIHREDPEDFDQVGVEKTILQFFFDGYNSSSDAITGVIAFIVANPDCMTRLREEIDEVFENKDDGDIEITQSELVGMSYLDGCVNEALRIAALPATSRRVTKAYKIPGTEITLPVGVSVLIPLKSLHMDPEFWENPTEFNPDRWNAENKSKIRSGTYGPFGMGPRACLGSIFAKFMMKMIIVYMIRFFEVENCDNLPKNFELDPNCLFAPLGGLNVKFHKREV